MNRIKIVAAVTWLLCAAAAGAQSAHAPEFWRDLRARQFVVSPTEPVLPLALEATRLLGSPDPTLRDETAFEALASWVYQHRRLNDQELGIVLSQLVSNARTGLGEPEGDGLYLRSFSILVLSVLAAADLKQPFLDQRRFDELIDLALDELARERDLRGYIPGKGWGHATAHCADLLKFLARSTRLRRVQQPIIVNAIAQRLRSAGIVFVWGEDARLAAALSAVATRNDADTEVFQSWFERVAKEHASFWNGPFNVPDFVALRAQLNALAELSADLAADSDPDSRPQAAIIRSGLRRLRQATQ